ncbi:hypothetical protein ACJJTC_002897 [Scirpophaga incertulas]
MTPATTIPARNQPISTSLTEIHRAKPQRQRSRSRQSERSARSDRSTDPTPERSGSRSSLGPPLDEPRALVQTPIPGYGPSAPTPFTSSTAPETPRTQKRAREEVDSDKSDQTKPAVRPKTDPSPASQASQAQPQPSTSYADQVRTTRIAEEENKIKTTAEPQPQRLGPNEDAAARAKVGKPEVQPPKNANTQQRATTTITTKVVETRSEAPPRKQKVREEIEARAAPRFRCPRDNPRGHAERQPGRKYNKYKYTD